MPVQVPTLNRFQPTNDASVGRVEARVPDVSQLAATQSNAIEKVASGVLNYMTQQEQQTAKSIGNEEENNYRRWKSSKLAEIADKHQAGDPTPVFEKFRLEEEEYKKSIYDKHKGTSSVIQQAIRNNILSVDNGYAEREATLETNKRTNWEYGVSRDKVKLLQSDMLQTSAIVDPKNPSSLGAFRKNINDVINENVRWGRDTGSVSDVQGEIDPLTGKPEVKTIVSDHIKLQNKKDVGDGIVDAIKNLVASGELEKANYLKEEFKDYINAADLHSIGKQTEKELLHQKANLELEKIRNLPEDKAKAAIDKLPFELAEQVSQRYNSFQAGNEKRLKKIESDNFNAALTVVDQRMRSDNPFHNASDLENDPTIKRLLPQFEKNPKKLQALYHMVEQPKNSNMKSKGQAYDVLFNGDLRGMTPETFNELMVGLNKQDRTMFENQYRKFNAQTPSEETQQVKGMGYQLQQELDRVGYVKMNNFGKYEDEDKDKITAMKQDLTIALDKKGPMNPKEQTEFIKKFVSDKLAGQVFKAPEKEKPVQLFRKPIKETIVNPTESDEVKRQNLQRDFRKKNNRWPTPQELNELMKTGAK